MNKRLFTVRIEAEVVVLAESEAQANHLARTSTRYDDDEFSIWASEMSSVPPGWGGSELPYGGPEATIDEWIARGAAPNFRGKERTNAG